MNRIKLVGGSAHNTTLIAEPIVLKGLVINDELYVTDQVLYMGVEQFRYVGKAGGTHE